MFVVKERNDIIIKVRNKSKNNRDSKKTILNLGNVKRNLIKDPLKLIKEIVKSVSAYYEEKLFEQAIPLKEDNSVINLGSLYLKKAIKDLGLVEFFKKKQRKFKVGFKFLEMFMMLIFSKIIEPSSFRHSYLNGSRFIGGFNCILEDVYESLNYFAEFCEEIQKVCYDYSRHLWEKTKMMILYFDGTNAFYTSDIEDEDKYNEEGELEEKGLRKLGFSKENRPKPIVNIGLITLAQGYPIGFSVFSGKVQEKVELIPLLERMQKGYGINNFILTADRGLYSGNIIAFLEKRDSKLGDKENYIIGMPARIGTKSLINWITDKGEYNYLTYIAKDGTQKIFKYKCRVAKKKIAFKEDDKEKSYYALQLQLVYRSKRYAKREKHKREKLLEKAQKMIQEPSLFKAKSRSGAAKIINVVHLNEGTGEVANKMKLDIDYEKVKKQELLDGVYVITSNLTQAEPIEIYQIYKRLWLNERDFRILKSDLKLRPIYVRDPKHILAYVLINIIALTCLRYLQDFLDYEFPVEEIIFALRDFNCYKFEGKFIIPFTNKIINRFKEKTGIGFKKIGYSKRELSSVYAWKKC